MSWRLSFTDSLTGIAVLGLLGLFARPLVWINLLLIVLTLAAVGVVGGAIWLIWQAIRIWQARQVPPPGSRVYHHVNVVEGAAARRYALTVGAIGVVVAVLGLITVWQIVAT